MKGIDASVAESGGEGFVLVGLSAFDRDALPGAGDEVGVHAGLLAEHQHIEADAVMAGDGLQEVDRNIGLTALELLVVFGGRYGNFGHLLFGEFEDFAQPAQPGCNRENGIVAHFLSFRWGGRPPP